jgi:hypothetical protein
VFRLPRGQAAPARDEVKLDFNVDNIRWTADGMLLAAGQDFATGLTCPCAFPLYARR